MKKGTRADHAASEAEAKLAQQFQMPLELGDGTFVVGDDDTAHEVHIDKGERAILAKLQDNRRISPRFWIVYQQLRSKGHAPEVSVIGAWYGMGKHAPTGIGTQAQLAQVLGIHRVTVIRNLNKVRAFVLSLRGDWFAQRVMDVDEAAYEAAISVEGSARDRELFYRLAKGAGVDVKLESEGAGIASDWMKMLAVSREANGEAA